MKTMGVALGTAGLAGFGLFTPPAVAQAAVPAAPAKATCSGVKIISAAYLRRFGGSPVVGSIQLRRDSCSRYWGVLIMYDPLPANAFATAYLIRYRGATAAATLSCDSAGGTGRIRPRGTTCRTPLVTDPGGSLRFIASGHEYHGGNGWARVSWGQTARVR
jgi:hypothetical protein